jgi:serine/threonine-protein kinase
LHPALLLGGLLAAAGLAAVLGRQNASAPSGQANPQPASSALPEALPAAWPASAALGAWPPAASAVLPAATTPDASAESGVVKAPAAPRPRPPAARLAAAAPSPQAEIITGSVQLAISPWGRVEVNGQAAGTTPPLTRLSLPEGTHTITVRNEDFPPFVATVRVSADKPANIRHRFGP